MCSTVAGAANASRGLLSFASLHNLQAGTMFEAVCAPPRMSGRTWSRVRLLEAPQYAQRWLKNRKALHQSPTVKSHRAFPARPCFRAFFAHVAATVRFPLYLPDFLLQESHREGRYQTGRSRRVPWFLPLTLVKLTCGSLRPQVVQGSPVRATATPPSRARTQPPSRRSPRSGHGKRGPAGLLSPVA
jgi:hypothetical protein